MKEIFKEYGIIIENDKLLKVALTVLEIVCSDYLYNNTDYEEGKMSKLRSLYVCENALYEYSKEINLKKYILLGNGIDEANKTIIADVFEALMAVVYLEKGLDAVKKIFNELIVPYIIRKEDFLMDYKSLLQESVQTVKKSVEYKLINESGPAHKKDFEVEVIIDGLVFGKAHGGSKKEAEQNAAKIAYMKRAK